MRKILLLLGALLISLSAHAAEKFKEVSLPPVHEEKKDASFQAYFEKLQKAVDKKDSAELLALVSKQIKFSFGAEEDSKAAFEKEWNLKKDPRKSKLWEELGRVLKEGVAKDAAEEFSAPSYYSRWPNDFDAFSTQLIYGEDIPVRQKAAASAPILRKASYLVVRAEYSEDLWRKVTLPSGIDGYVEGKYLRSPVGYRALFRRAGKTWEMTHFIAGD